MIAKCVWCPSPHVTAIKAPFFDLRVTHGMCPEAEARENARLGPTPGEQAIARLDSIVQPLLSRILPTPAEGYAAAPAEILQADLEEVVKLVEAAFEQRRWGRGTLMLLAESVDRVRGRTPSGVEVKR